MRLLSNDEIAHKNSLILSVHQIIQDYTPWSSSETLRKLSSTPNFVLEQVLQWEEMVEDNGSTTILTAMNAVVDAMNTLAFPNLVKIEEWAKIIQLVTSLFVHNKNEFVKALFTNKGSSNLDAMFRSLTIYAMFLYKLMKLNVATEDEEALMTLPQNLIAGFNNFPVSVYMLVIGKYDSVIQNEILWQVCREQNTTGDQFSNYTTKFFIESSDQSALVDSYKQKSFPLTQALDDLEKCIFVFYDDSFINYVIDALCWKNLLTPSQLTTVKQLEECEIFR